MSTQTTEKPEVETTSQMSNPVNEMQTERSLLIFIVLGILTIGIYPIVFFSGISNDINKVASEYDGKETMHYCLLFFLVGWVTLGIGYFVWFHRISNRIGNYLYRKDISYNFSAKDYWLWGVLGSLIIVGPFIYLHKLATAMNKIAELYNQKG